MKTRRLGVIGECEARTQRRVRSRKLRARPRTTSSRRRARPGDGVLRFETNSRNRRRKRMTTVTLAGKPVEVDAEGFLEKPEQWTKEMGEEIARSAGIEQLTDRHWQVIEFMRKTYLDTGSAPSMRALGKTSGVAIKELYELCLLYTSDAADDLTRVG